MGLPSLLLPARATPAAPPPSTGVALGGVDRRGGRISDREGAAAHQVKLRRAMRNKKGRAPLLSG